MTYLTREVSMNFFIHFSSVVDMQKKKKKRNRLTFQTLQFGLKITRDKTVRYTTHSFLGAEVSQPGKWDKLRKVRYRHSGEKSKPAIQDYTVSRSDLTKDFECLVAFLIEILVQTSHISHAFQVKLFPASKKSFCSLISSLSRLPRRFSIWMEQKISFRIWAIPRTAHRVSLPHMNYPLILKFILFRLLVLFTLLNLHFFVLIFCYTTVWFVFIYNFLINAFYRSSS